MTSFDAQAGDQWDNEEENDEDDDEVDVRDDAIKHDVLLGWVINTKDNNVAVTMTTRFIVVIGAATEQLAAMGLGGRPRNSYPDSGIRIRSGTGLIQEAGGGGSHLNLQHFPQRNVHCQRHKLNPKAPPL